MPIHIDEMTSDVSVFAGDLPLNARQIDQLVKLVLERLEQRARDRQAGRAATIIRNRNVPPMWHGEMADRGE